MKIFIPSYNRPKRAYNLSLPYLFEEAKIPYTLALHNPQQLELYALHSGLPAERMRVMNAPIGMSNIRQAILDIVPEGEWLLMMDDNVTGFTAVDDEYQRLEKLPVKQDPKHYRAIYEQKIPLFRFLEYAQETVAKAESIGAKLCGFATTENFFFRDRKWRTVGYVIGRATLIKKTGLKYDLNIQQMDDYAFTAENLRRFGLVLVNNYAVPQKKHYQNGGCGTYTERLQSKIADCQYLMNKFPGLFSYKKKAGTHPLAELHVRFTREKQVEDWRMSYGK